MDNNNYKPKTILETLIEMNNSATISTMSQSNKFITHCYGVDISRNRIHKSKDKWTKYVDLTIGLIHQYMPSMCLIKKDNVSKTFQGHDGSMIHIEYRFKGDPSRQYCEISVSDGSVLVYNKKKETPKKVYKKFTSFILDYSEDYPESSLFQ